MPMKKSRVFSISAMSIALIVGLAFFVFAQSDASQSQKDSQHGGHHMMGGRGDHHSSTHGVAANLSEEQTKKMEQERQAYGEQTRELKAQIFQKNLELRAEIAKLQPDPKKAAELQKELSNMEAQLDRKHIDHILRIKAIDPYFAVGHDMMRMGGMGHGAMGSGMGQGSMGGGCPMMRGGMGGMGKHHQN
jgi:Spy/CpxP family protein refolding chaperone